MVFGCTAVRDTIWFSVAPQPVSCARFYVILSEATWNGEAARSRQNLLFGNRLWHCGRFFVRHAGGVDSE